MADPDGGPKDPPLDTERNQRAEAECRLTSTGFKMSGRSAAYLLTVFIYLFTYLKYHTVNQAIKMIIILIVVARVFKTSFGKIQSESRCSLKCYFYPVGFGNCFRSSFVA